MLDQDLLVTGLNRGPWSSLVRYARAPAFIILFFLHSIAHAAGPQIVRGIKLTLPFGATVAFEGDSLTYGIDFSETAGQPPINGSIHPRSALPFPEEVGKLLSGRVRIANRGSPGDRSIDGVNRWRSVPMA